MGTPASRGNNCQDRNFTVGSAMAELAAEIQVREQQNLYDVIKWIGTSRGQAVRLAALTTLITACRSGSWAFRALRISLASELMMGLTIRIVSWTILEVSKEV